MLGRIFQSLEISLNIGKSGGECYRAGSTIALLIQSVDRYSLACWSVASDQWSEGGRGGRGLSESRTTQINGLRGLGFVKWYFL